MVVVEMAIVVVVSFLVVVVSSGASRSVFTQGEVLLARATRRSRTSPSAPASAFCRLVTASRTYERTKETSA